MNLKVALAVLSVLVAAALLAAHSPLRLLNALTPTNTFRLFADIPYGPGERQVLDVYLPARVARDWPTEPNAGAPVVVFFYGEAGSRASATTICSSARRWRRAALSPWCPTTAPIRPPPFPASSTTRPVRSHGRAGTRLRSAATRGACS
jgi:hypothetical protein